MDKRVEAEHEPLSGLFWILLWVATPAAVAWAVCLPWGHPQKKRALFWSILALVVAFILLGVCIGLIIWMVRIIQGA